MTGPAASRTPNRRRLPITVSATENPAEYSRQRRAYLRALGACEPERIPHGTRKGYDDWGCRCKPCTAVTCEAVLLSRRNSRKIGA